MTQVVHSLQRDRIKFSHWIDYYYSLVFRVIEKTKGLKNIKTRECYLFLRCLPPLRSTDLDGWKKFQCQSIKNLCSIWTAQKRTMERWNDEEWAGKRVSERVSRENGWISHGFRNMLRCCNQFKSRRTHLKPYDYNDLFGRKQNTHQFSLPSHTMLLFGVFFFPVWNRTNKLR